MFREQERTTQALSVFLDVVAIFVSFCIALTLRVFHDQLPLVGWLPSVPWVSETIVRSDYAVLFAVSTLAWIFALRASSIYRPNSGKNWGTILVACSRAVLVAAVASGAANFVLKMGSISRIFFVYYFTISFIIILAKQLAFAAFYRRLYYSTYGRQHALVIGVGEAALSFARVLQDAAESGYELVALLLRDGSERPSGTELGVPIFCGLSELDTVLRYHPVDEVFIVAGASDMADLSPVAEDMIQCGRVVSLVAPAADAAGGVRGRITEFGGIPMLSYGPMPRDPSRDVGKRAFDVAVGSLLAVMALPVIGLLALIIKLYDRGPILFAQTRIGRFGREFTLYKFRSMHRDAEAMLRADPELYNHYIENDYKLPEEADPRITRLGRFMRRTSLDELPQIWNVIRGDMAIVGPRPIVPDELAMYQPYAEVLLAEKPGLTGNWQVNGRSEVRYPLRAYMDLDYIGSHSLREDLVIIAKTVPAVLRRTGAH